MTDNKWLVETQNLVRVYSNGNVRALDGVSINIADGEIVAIMGPSGSGKSTLLNMLGALDQPTEGKVYVNQQDLSSIKDVDNFRAKTVGFIFQMHNLLPTMNAAENVEVPMMGHYSAKERRQRSVELLNLVGLGDRSNHLPNQLSGGQRQRVAIARALANKPPLVLADEPTGNLDTESGKELIALLHDLNKSQGTTFAIVTHDPAIARQTNRVIVMEDGKIARQDIIGSPIEEDLKMWQHSGLGRRILQGELEDLESFDLSNKQIEMIKSFLESNSNQT